MFIYPLCAVLGVAPAYFILLVVDKAGDLHQKQEEEGGVGVLCACYHIETVLARDRGEHKAVEALPPYNVRYKKCMCTGTILQQRRGASNININEKIFFFFQIIEPHINLLLKEQSNETFRFQRFKIITFISSEAPKFNRKKNIKYD